MLTTVTILLCLGCLLIGGSIGFFVAVLLTMGKRSDAEAERTITTDEPYFKCKTNAIHECSNTCCKFCLGANECDWACQGDPANCGLSFEADQNWD